MYGMHLFEKKAESDARNEEKTIDQLAEETLAEFPFEVKLERIFVPYLCVLVFDGLLIHAGDDVYKGHVCLRIHAYHTRDHTQLIDKSEPESKEREKAEEGEERVHFKAQNLAIVYEEYTPCLKNIVNRV